MARAHAASACVQSDSIKGLAQSIAKPAYHRLLDRGARASPRGPHPDHRLPDHDLPRRLRPGDRPEPAEARRDEARPLGHCRHAGRAHRSPGLGAGRIAPRPSSACRLLARPDSGLGRRRRPPRHRHRRRPARAGARADRWRASATPPAFSSHQRGAAADRAGASNPAVTDITLPERRTARWRSSASSSRCPARSSSSRKGSIRSGARTRRCRSRCRPPPASWC